MVGIPPDMEVLLKGRLSTVDVLVLTSLYQLLSILKILFTFFTKQAMLIRRSTVQRLPLSVSVPCPNVLRTFFGNVRLIAKAMRTFIVIFLKAPDPDTRFSREIIMNTILELYTIKLLKAVNNYVTQEASGIVSHLHPSLTFARVEVTDRDQ